MTSSNFAWSTARYVSDSRRIQGATASPGSGSSGDRRPRRLVAMAPRARGRYRHRPGTLRVPGRPPWTGGSRRRRSAGASRTAIPRAARRFAEAPAAQAGRPDHRHLLGEVRAALGDAERAAQDIDAARQGYGLAARRWSWRYLHHQVQLHLHLGTPQGRPPARRPRPPPAAERLDRPPARDRAARHRPPRTRPDPDRRAGTAAAACPVHRP